MIVACSLLVLVEIAAQQQPAHPDDGVHRRSDLVAHGREEDALRGVGVVGDLACVLGLGEETGIVERDRGQLRQALQQVDLRGRERPRVGGVAGDPERADRRLARPQRNGDEAPDQAARDPGISARPSVVVVDHDALTGGPDLTGDADAGPSRLPRSDSNSPVAIRFSISSASAAAGRRIRAACRASHRHG